MSDRGLDEQADDLANKAKDVGRYAGRKVGGAAKKAIGKVTSKAFKKAMKVALISAIKTTFLSLMGWILIPTIIILIFLSRIFGSSIEEKQYFMGADENTIEGDSIERYQSVKEDEVSSYARGLLSRTRSITTTNNSEYDKDVYERVVLSEQNQAVENYHYYNSTNSVLQNKIYIPIKGIDIEKKSTEMYNQLIKEGVIEEEGNERFISSESLSQVEKEWESKYKKDGGSFEWTDSKLKKKLDKKINTGITVKGFDDDNIGKLAKVKDEEDKINIKDEYGREKYFQLPEELLSSLNKNIYNSEFLYDEPFVKGVKFTYEKKKVSKEEISKDEESKPVINKKTADNSKYTAEQFNKEFAKKNGLLKGTGQKFIDYANKYDIDAGLAVSIAIHESGYGTSKLAKNNYNFFGMKATSKEWKKFNSVEEGIEGGISYISRKYISQGITSIEAIGKIYCDPPEEWIQKINTLYKNITGGSYDGSGAGQGSGSNLTAFRGVPEYEVKLDNYGISRVGGTKENGLGTVFLYKPTVELQVKRGYQMEQVLTTSLSEKVKIEETTVAYNGKKHPNQTQTITDKDGRKVTKTIEYEVKEVPDGNGGKKKVQVKTVYEQKVNYTPSVKATPIEEIEAKVTYVLDKAITFAGVYEFEYGLVSEDVSQETNTSERPIEGAYSASGQALSEFSTTESRTIKIYEKPIGIKNTDISTEYMDRYLQNLEVSVPKDIINRFDLSRLVNAFKGEKKSISSQTSSEGSGNTNTSASQAVEKWRSMVEPIAKKWGIDPDILLALMHNESTGNPHSQNPNYKGLFAIGATNFQEYFKKDPKFRSYTAADRVPSCSANGPHNHSEHERVAEFQIEYVARRLTAQMGLYLKKVKGVDYRTDTITPEDLQDAILFTCAAYQTGEYGQLVAVDFHGEEKLYSNNGVTYEQLFMEYISKGGKYMYAKTPAVKKILSKYRFVNDSNRTYMKKAYTHYPLYSGGLALNQITMDSEKLKLFDPSLWYKHPAMGKSNDNDEGKSTDHISIGTNGASMNIEKIKEYKEYELTGDKNSSYKGNGTIVRKSDSGEVEMIRKSAVGMIEGKAAYDVHEEKNVFWSESYAQDYFKNGQPIKPLYGDELSSEIWKGKIEETSVYMGDRESLLNLSKMYGKEVYNIIKRALAQENKDFEGGKAGPNSFDHAGLLWYVFNYGSEKTYFDKSTIEEYYSKIATEVTEGDIRPGDIIFYTDAEKDKPDKIGVYLGNKVYLGINELEGKVKISKYTALQENKSYKILSVRRVLDYASGSETDVSSVVAGQLPPDMVKGDWVDPLGGVAYKDNGGVQPRRFHPIDKKYKFHAGADRGIPTGTPIYSMKAGTVVTAKNNPGGYGLYVVVNHGDGYTSLYAHLSKIQVQVGQQVNKGQQVGLSGNTGKSTGPHLHLEIAKGVPSHTNGTKDLYPKGSYLCPNQIVPGNPK